MERPETLDRTLQETCVSYFKKFPSEKHPFAFYIFVQPSGEVCELDNSYCTPAEAKETILRLLETNNAVNSSVYGFTWAMMTRNANSEVYDTLSDTYPERAEQKPINKL